MVDSPTLRTRSVSTPHLNLSVASISQLATARIPSSLAPLARILPFTGLAYDEVWPEAVKPFALDHGVTTVSAHYDIAPSQGYLATGGGWIGSYSRACLLRLY
jgi:hypothetical protein